MARKKTVGSGVTSKHIDYDAKAKKWKRARDVIAGQDAIYEGRTAYLPGLIDELPGEYKARLERTPFFNASWRTVSGFVGMLLRKDPVVTAPEGVKKYLEDVTLGGVSLAALCQEIVYEELVTSRIGLFVDHPPMTTAGMSKAEAEAAGHRPTITLFKAEAIINHRYDFRDNKKTLAQVRLAEEDSEADGEFGEKVEEIIRVLDLDDSGNYRQRKFKASTGQVIPGSEIVPLLDGKPLKAIPFFFIGPDGTDGAFEDPVLIDLFDLNLKHFQASADYVHAAHMTALPTPWITGYREETAFGDAGNGTAPAKPMVFRIGSTTAWVFPDHQTKVGFLEYTGAGLDALDKMVVGYERQMAAIGARMLAPEKSGVEAEGTLALRHSGEHSVLGAVAGAVSKGVTEALEVFAAWCGQAGECKVELNKNFAPLNVTPQQITAWLSAVQAGRMSGETFFWNMQRAEQYPDDLTHEEEQSRIDADPVPRPIQPGHLGPKDELADERTEQHRQEDMEREDRQARQAPPKKSAK